MCAHEDDSWRRKEQRILLICEKGMILENRISISNLMFDIMGNAYNLDVDMEKENPM